MSEEQTFEEQIAKSEKRYYRLVKWPLFAILIISSLVVRCGNWVTMYQTHQEEVAKNAPKVMVYKDEEVARNERRSHYSCLVFDFPDDSERKDRIQMIVELSNTRGPIGDWILGEKQMTARYDLWRQPSGEFRGNWYQFADGNNGEVPDYQGKASLVRNDNGTYTGECTWDDGTFIKTFNIVPPIPIGVNP